MPLTVEQLEEKSTIDIWGDVDVEKSIGEVLSENNNDLFQIFKNKIINNNNNFIQLLNTIKQQMIDAIHKADKCKKAKDKRFNLVSCFSRIRSSRQFKQDYSAFMECEHEGHGILKYLICSSVISQVNTLFEKDKSDDAAEPPSVIDIGIDVDEEPDVFDSGLKYVTGYCFVSILKREERSLKEYTGENHDHLKCVVSLIKELLESRIRDDSLMHELDRGRLQYAKPQLEKFVVTVHQECNNHCRVNHNENSLEGERACLEESTIIDSFDEALQLCKITVNDNVKNYVRDEFVKKLYHTWMKELIQNYMNNQDRTKDKEVAHQNECRRDTLKLFQPKQQDIE